MLIILEKKADLSIGRSLNTEKNNVMRLVANEPFILPKNIYRVLYKKKNRTKVLYRVRIRTKSMTVDKCFDHLSTAIAFKKMVLE